MNWDPETQRFPDTHSYGYGIQMYASSAKNGKFESTPAAIGIIKAAVEIIRILYKIAGFNTPEEAFKEYANDKWIHEYPEKGKTP